MLVATGCDGGNVTLLELLRRDHDVDVVGLDPLPVDDSGIDVPLVLRIFKGAIKDKDGWHVEDALQVGLYSFAKHLLWRDLREREADLRRSPLVEHLLDRPSDAVAEPAIHRVGVCYDDAYGPDLHAVAAARSLSVDAVIASHLAGEYRVAMYGFAPGYAYMAGVPDEIQVPRKPSPVRDVPGRSVIIAGPQCLITTMAMPTGWSIIGRAGVDVLRDDADRPFLFDVGDRVVFERVSAADLDRPTGR